MLRVKKYGGSSLDTVDKIKHIASEVQVGDIIVLSAAAGRTDSLVSTALLLGGDEAARKHLIALGEQESCLKIQLALSNMGFDARIIPWDSIGLTVEYCGGPVIACEPTLIQSYLEQGVIPIVPGFQALLPSGQLALLSRGGSDETAVAIAGALQAQCIIHSDVSRIYDHNQQAVDQISYQQLLQLIGPSQAPMSVNAINLAMHIGCEIQFRHWMHAGEFTQIN